MKLLIFFFLWTYSLSAQTVSTVYGLGIHPLVEISDQGQTQIQMLNIFGPGGQILAQVSSGKTRYLLADHWRSTRVIFKEDNSLLGSFDYTPYGETNSTGNVDSVLYRYTGEPVNFGLSELSSYHFYQREYDPNILRFTSVDSVRYNESPYIYSNSNPTNFMDPTGEQPTYTTLWLSGNLKASRVYGQETAFIDRYNHSLSSGHPGHPKIMHEDLSLNGGEGVRGSHFSDSPLGTIVVAAHAKTSLLRDAHHGVNIGDKESVDADSLFDRVFSRVKEIDPLGVEQVDSISLISCLAGCSYSERSSFADLVFAANFSGDNNFPKLDRVVSSPYMMQPQLKSSDADVMPFRFVSHMKKSQQMNLYFEDRVDVKLDSARFLRGHGASAINHIDEYKYRYYYRTPSRGTVRRLDRDPLNEPDSSGKLSFPSSVLGETLDL